MIDWYLGSGLDNNWIANVGSSIITWNIFDCLSKQVVIKHIRSRDLLNNKQIMDKLLSLFSMTFSCYSGKISEEENKQLFLKALDTDWSSVVALEDNWELLRFAIVIDEGSEVEIDKLCFNPKIKSKYFKEFMLYLFSYYESLSKPIRCEFALETRIWLILVNQFEFSVYWLKYSYKWVPFFVTKRRYLWVKKPFTDNDWIKYFAWDSLLDLWLECRVLDFPIKIDPKDYLSQTNDLFSHIWKLLEQWRIIEYYKLYNDKLYIFLR